MSKLLSNMSKPTNCLVIAGEQSGEEHAQSFLPELMRRNPDMHFWGVGGDDFKKRNIEILYHLRDFSSIGFSEVFFKLHFYIQAEKRILEEVLKRDCKIAILIDFQGFNLKIAKKLKKLGVKVLYYVAPQAWLWKPYRANSIKKYVHTVFSIIPFEKEWFEKRGVKNLKLVPHPVFSRYKHLLSEIRDRKNQNFKKQLNILILPGSRNSEVKTLLPIFAEVAKKAKADFPAKISIVKTTSVENKYYDLHEGIFDKEYSPEQLVEAFSEADICLAASGTVTLTCGLFEVPTIVCYKVSLFTEFIAMNFIGKHYDLSLTNILLKETIFPELLQQQANPELVYEYLKYLLTEKVAYEKILNKIKKIKDILSADDFKVVDYMDQVLHEDS
ncbi:MAG: lipid-A-disaccharide synthase [Bacteriovoracaceae bacterium]|nr:lipid-A-disaccharide synthase [Bacteriovoracaceae bacterium]